MTSSRLTWLWASFACGCACDPGVVSDNSDAWLMVGASGFVSWHDACAGEVRLKAQSLGTCKDETIQAMSDARVTSGPFELTTTSVQGGVASVGIKATGDGDGEVEATLDLASGERRVVREGVSGRTPTRIETRFHCHDAGTEILFGTDSSVRIQWASWAGNKLEVLREDGAPPPIDLSGASFDGLQFRTHNTTGPQHVTSPFVSSVDVPFEVVDSAAITVRLDVSTNRVTFNASSAGRELCQPPLGPWIFTTPNPDACSLPPQDDGGLMIGYWDAIGIKPGSRDAGPCLVQVDHVSLPLSASAEVPTR